MTTAELSVIFAGSKAFLKLLWLSCVADADIIFWPCGFFFFFFFFFYLSAFLA